MRRYLVRYDDTGFAWAWWVNPRKVPSSTRPLPSVALVPGIARVEGPVPRPSSSLLAPVLADAASAEPYIMQGKWHRNYCYYIVFDAVRRLDRLRVTFANGTLALLRALPFWGFTRRLRVLSL